MPPSALQHRRTHNLLLLSKLLNQRDAATSPFTLLCDSLNQTARPVVSEYIRRAKNAGTRIVFVSFETLRRPKGVDEFITAWKDGTANTPGKANWHAEVANALASTQEGGKKKTSSAGLPALLSSFLSPSVSLLAVYHTDIPLPCPSQPYTPSPLTLLRYLATTLLTTHNLSHILSAHAARSRSLVAPTFGLAEDREGVVQGLLVAGKNDGGDDDGEGPGLVLELEHRRKSGRGVREWYFLPTSRPVRTTTTTTMPMTGGKAGEGILLLEDHGAYRRITAAEEDRGGKEDAAGERAVSTTFEMGLTERQRRDREGVVLPYFDAQKDGDGPGEGGRILYDYGSEDDFDEDEDEI
nr:elongator complex protein 5 [Quercus suber]